jgi:hypothetical protein
MATPEAMALALTPLSAASSVWAAVPSAGAVSANAVTVSRAVSASTRHSSRAKAFLLNSFFMVSLSSVSYLQFQL